MPETLPSRAPTASALAGQQVVHQALSAVRSGDLDAAQLLLGRQDSAPMSLAQLFRLYQAEIEAQAHQLQEGQARAEQALAWAMRLFRELPMSALLVDDEGRIIEANDMAEDEFGLRAGQRVLPLPLRRLMADGHAELRLASLLPEAQPGHPVGIEDLAMRSLSGELRWADLRITVVPAQASQTGRSLRLCAISDRTARIEAERAREAAIEAEHARDLAQSASRAKSQLLSRVSHELRTPLNAVIGFAHLLMHDGTQLDDTGRRRIEHIAAAGQHLLNLVDEVLEINRAEVGLMRVQLESVDLVEEVHQALALQEPMADAQSIALVFDPPPATLPTLVLADSRRLAQVLANLLGNAIKYNRPGGWVRVVIEVPAAAQPGTPGEAPAGELVLSVHDNGLGMDSEQLAHLFEPFNRLGAERTPTPGHGLGLSITRLLVQAMNGRIGVESTAGEGSRFSVHLPIAP